MTTETHSFRPFIAVCFYPLGRRNRIGRGEHRLVVRRREGRQVAIARGHKERVRERLKRLRVVVVTHPGQRTFKMPSAVSFFVCFSDRRPQVHGLPDMPEGSVESVWVIRRGSRGEKKREHGFISINPGAMFADMPGWGWSNFETSYAKGFMSTVESSVAVRLRKFIVVDTPDWFGTVWAIIKTFVSTKFASKWHFVSRGSAELDKLIAPEALPVAFGGQFDIDIPSTLYLFIICLIIFI